jgi:hypothetical protein
MTQNVNKASDGMYHKAYKHVDNAPAAFTQIATAGAHAITAAEFLGGIIFRDCASSARTDTLPTAAAFIAALRGEKVGDIYSCLIINDSDAAETITIDVATGTTIAQIAGTRTIVQNTAKHVYLRLTNVTAGSEAMVAYIG